MSDDPINSYFWSKLLRRIVRRTGNDDEAEDLLHSAFIRLERYRAKYTVKNRAAFLVTTAVNIGIDRYRRGLHFAESDTEEQLQNLVDPSPAAEEVVDAAARLNRVKSGLLQLTPRTREIFLMHRLDEMKYREIALKVGISQSAVEKHIAKAALFLGEWMEGW